MAEISGDGEILEIVWIKQSARSGQHKIQVVRQGRNSERMFSTKGVGVQCFKNCWNVKMMVICVYILFYLRESFFLYVGSEAVLADKAAVLIRVSTNDDCGMYEKGKQTRTSSNLKGLNYENDFRLGEPVWLI